ncbi:pseudouridine synthase [Lutibacter sp.]|uniref:pseudouridine synthase n=1 Tax=Lutibacter sp. TaxID=1925666 RepID=UPI002736A6F6|nr:pseudouridine synthase [Lutibacter sp.]MDP3313479.1 pseudouridine synthase [Lutibacter sp.]
MKSNKNSSRGRQPEKKSPSKSPTNKFAGKRNSSKDKPVFKKARPISKEEKLKSQTEKSVVKKLNTSTEDGIRLNKYISNSGICSRREADVYIKAGNAMVNGKIMTEMGYMVKPTDEIKFDGSLINPEKKRYVLLNKPKNYITTMEDERGRKTVMDIIANASKERVYPVGRLDRNTTGLLLFTNDGDMAKKLTHPKHKIQKLYHASLDKKLAASDLQKIAEGFVLEGKPVWVDEIAYITNQSKSEIGIKIHSGRNRIVRRIFENFGYTVVKLDRVIFAGLTKKDLPRGHYRHLTEMELNNLRML